MGEFEVNVSQLEFKDWNHISQGKDSIGRPVNTVSSFWGRTFFRFDQATNKLYAKNFNIFERVFRLLFGYGKEYNKSNLWEFAKTKKWVPNNEPCPAGNLFRQKMAEKFTEFCQKRNYLFKGLTVVYRPKSCSTAEFIELFENGLDVNVHMDSTNSSPTALYAAVKRGDKELAKYLIGKGANVSVVAQSSMAWTPLALAVASHYDDLAVLLMNNGADVKAKSGEDLTALHFAVGGGQTFQFKVNPQVVRALLDKGADINAASEGRTALGMSVQRKDIETAKLLLERGADINAGAHYRFPLFVAIRNYDQKMVELLLNHDAKLEVVGTIVQDPQTQRVISKDVTNAFSEALPVSYADGWKPNLQIIQLLIGKTANLNALDEKGQTPLHYAVERGHVEAAELLIKNGAKFDIPNSEGNTAAQLARTPEMQALLK